MNSKENFLKIDNLSISLDDKKAIDQIHCSFNLNRNIGIIGETGSGKSTLLKTIAGLIQSDTGNIYYNEERIKGPNEQLIPGHPSIAYLSQHFELRNNYQVWDILSFANLLTDAEADEIYKYCKIDHLLNRWTDELSGGEKQRIALAKLLITKPSLLLLDEPFSNLDNHHKKTIYEVLNDVKNKFNLSIIMVSHDAMDILNWTDDLLVLKKGQIIQYDTTQNIFNFPLDEYTAGLLGDYQLLTADALFSEIIEGYSYQELRQLFVRPHYFKIDNETQSKTLEAVVKSIDSKGFYFLIEVGLGIHHLIIASLDHNLRKGDSVKIRYSKDSYHVI